VIQSLQLQNFKCFENQIIPFGALTLLSGLNGMGKSSVLQSLLLLRQSYQRQLLQETGLALNGDLVEIGTAEDALFENALAEEIGLALVLDDNIQGRWHFKYDPENDILGYASPPVVAAEIFQASLFSDNFHCLQAERIGPRTVFEKSDSLVREHKQLGIHGEYATHFLEVFGKEKICCTKLAFPGVEFQSLNQQVEAWLGEITPGTRLHLTDHLGMDLINLQYSFTKKQQVSNQYRATNVGFGITFVLPVIIALLSSKPGALVLLENPEAHLHPRGQAKMGELMARAASCGIQVVVETHSDHVLNGIRLAVHDGLLKPEQTCFYYFAHDENGVTQLTSPKIDKKGQFKDWPRGFFDEWNNLLFKLIS
jgi:predicted ATPase